MKKIKTDRKSLIRWKIYVDRARMYIGYIQFFMIGFVFLKAYKDTSVGTFIFENSLLFIPLMFIAFFVISLILGRLDTVLGLREEELRNSSASNPVMRDILKNLEDLKVEIQELKMPGK